MIDHCTEPVLSRNWLSRNGVLLLSLDKWRIGRWGIKDSSTVRIQLETISLLDVSLASILSYQKHPILYRAEINYCFIISEPENNSSFNWNCLDMSQNSNKWPSDSQSSRLSLQKLVLSDAQSKPREIQFIWKLNKEKQHIPRLE